jgi:serine/threonine-protein kinase
METSPRQDGTDYAILVGTEGGSSGAATGAPVREESLALLPESTIGGIQVVRLIGCGKVSESWFGVDANLQREVVVKVLRKPWCSDPQVLGYFEKQIANISALKHPNLANILDVGQEDGMLYWITEWVKGGSVGPKVRRKGPMDIASALAAVDQAAAGLAFGASAHVIHGGLKPENILIERTRSVKVSDLGIEYSARQLISGTPGASKQWITEFMAPEVRSGAIPDVRSDIFSLGAVLLYLVAGVVPHDGMLDGSSPRITPGLRELLIKMTAPDPRQRLQDYGQVRAAIAEAESSSLSAPLSATPSNWLHDTNARPAASEDERETLIEAKPAQDTPSPADTQPVIVLDEPTPAPAYLDETPEPAEPAVLTSLPADLAIPVARTEVRPELNATVPKISADKARKLVSAQRRTPWALISVLVLVVAGLSGGGAWYLAKKRQAPASGNANEPATVAQQPAAAKVSAPVQTAPVAPTLPPASESAPVAPAPTDAPQVASQPVPQPAQPDAGTFQAPPGVDPAALPALAAAAAKAGAASAPPPGVVTPAGAQPAATASGEIIVDGAPGTLQLEPAAGWRISSETRDSFNGGSVVAQVTGELRKATFLADVPRDGRYQVYLYWISRTEQLRSAAVPVTVQTMTGPINITVDQVNTPTGFNLIGTYNLKAGSKQPVVTISTAGVTNESGSVHVSADALKLVPLGS